MAYDYRHIFSVGTIGEVERKYSGIFPLPLEAYLRSLGFYEYTMNPRFLNGYDYDKLTTDVPCLRKDFGNAYSFRVFVNQRELYLEVQTPYRSLETSKHVTFESPPRLRELEKYFNELLDEHAHYWEDLVEDLD